MTSPEAPAPACSQEARTGVLAGIVAYTAWGLFPIYFKQLGEVAALDVLAWRIVLSAALLFVVMCLRAGLVRLWQQLKACSDWPLVFAATVVISINWLTFIMAVAAGEVLQSSLGYFLVPLVNSLLGMLVFRERPNRWKQSSLWVAAVGLSTTFIIAGVVPWYALVMALSFGLYGMLRKRMSLDSTAGLLVETSLLTPLAIGWLLIAGTALGDHAPAVGGWLMLSGVITSIPLLLMGFAVRRIELGTLGVLQYIAPIMHFVVAVWVYDERMSPALVAAFLTTVLAIICWMIGTFYRASASNGSSVGPGACKSTQSV